MALYLRLRRAWIGALALLGVTVAWNLAPELLSGRWGEGTVGPIRAALIAGYLIFRRGQFGRSDVARPRLVSGPGIAALAVVVLLGGGAMLLMTVDDARRSFPVLEQEVAVPPEQENGYLLIEQMRAKWPLEGDEQLDAAFEGMPEPGAAPNVEWVQSARAVVHKYADCLARTRELVREPHCVEVPFLTGMAWVERDQEWLSYSRHLALLLTISAQLQAADRHWGAALDDAGRIVQLGVLISKESTTLIQSLFGVAVAYIGLEGLQVVGGEVPDAALLRAHLGPPLPEDAFRKGFNTGMAEDFQGMMGVFKE